MTTAFQVNTTSIPTASSARPSGPRRPNSQSSSEAAGHGWQHQGQRHDGLEQRLCRRRSCAPAPIRWRSPAGERASVAVSAISTVNRAMAQVSAVTACLENPEAAAHEHIPRGRASQESQEAPALSLARSADHGGGDHDGQIGECSSARNEERHHGRTSDRVGGVDDAGVDPPGFDGGQYRAHGGERDHFRRDRRPDTLALEPLPAVDTRGHGRRFTHRHPPHGGAGQVRERDRLARSPGTMIARLLVKRRVRVPGTSRLAFSTASIWRSSALRNSATFAPSMIWRASVLEPPGLSETGTPVAARYRPAISTSDS